MAIDSTIKDVQGDQAQLEKAIKDAGEKIRKIENFKKAISIFATLIGLAEAIVLRDPSAILTAFTKLKETAQA
jgi:autotransporter adhesin